MAQIVSILVLLFTFNTSYAGSPPTTSTPLIITADLLPDMVERVSPGVVNISSTTVTSTLRPGMENFFQLWGIPRERKQTSLGSGFLIDGDGYILTNYHVVDQATEVLATLVDKRQFKARIIGKDDKMDLALLQIKDSDGKVPAHLKPATLGNSDTVRIAETVVAVGNPFGLQHTVTRGIISAKNRTIGLGPFDNFLQTDASINPGNSGGPLFNIKGEVIGINSAIRSDTGQSSGLGFAIPINEAKLLVPDLKKYGRIPRPWLGILGERLTPQLSIYYELPLIPGVLIYDLVERGPADQANIQQGDILISMKEAESPKEVPTHEPNDVERLLAKHKANDTITVKIRRGRKTLTLPVKLKELPKLDHLPRGIL